MEGAVGPGAGGTPEQTPVQGEGDGEERTYDRWTIKKAERRRTGACELRYWRTLEGPLDSKEIQPVLPKGNQS